MSPTGASHPLVPLVMLAVVLVLGLAVPAAAKPRPGSPGGYCGKEVDCQDGLYCGLLKGKACCLPKTCYPACEENHQCLREESHCGEEGISCDCPPKYTCHKLKPLPLTKPAVRCRPGCKGNRICFLTMEEEERYECVEPFPGCWTWYDCTIGAVYTYGEMKELEAKMAKKKGKGKKDGK